jgi:hypothetical protein
MALKDQYYKVAFGGLAGNTTTSTFTGYTSQGNTDYTTIQGIQPVYRDIARGAIERVQAEEGKMQVRLTLKEAQYLETLTEKEPMLKDILAKIEEGADFQIVVSFRGDDD